VPAREEQFLDPGQVIKILFASLQVLGLQALFQSYMFNVSWLQHMRWHLIKAIWNGLYISTYGILSLDFFEPDNRVTQHPKYRDQKAMGLIKRKLRARYPGEPDSQNEIARGRFEKLHIGVIKT
jgi:hypothetical protein